MLSTVDGNGKIILYCFLLWTAILQRRILAMTNTSISLYMDMDELVLTHNDNFLAISSLYSNGKLNFRSTTFSSLNISHQPSVPSLLIMTQNSTKVTPDVTTR